MEKAVEADETPVVAKNPSGLLLGRYLQELRLTQLLPPKLLAEKLNALFARKIERPGAREFSEEGVIAWEKGADVPWEHRQLLGEFLIKNNTQNWNRRGELLAPFGDLEMQGARDRLHATFDQTMEKAKAELPPYAQLGKKLKSYRLETGISLDRLADAMSMQANPGIQSIAALEKAFGGKKLDEHNQLWMTVDPEKREAYLASRYRPEMLAQIERGIPVEITHDAAKKFGEDFIMTIRRQPRVGKIEPTLLSECSEQLWCGKLSEAEKAKLTTSEADIERKISLISRKLHDFVKQYSVLEREHSVKTITHKSREDVANIMHGNWSPLGTPAQRIDQFIDKIKTAVEKPADKDSEKNKAVEIHNRLVLGELQELREEMHGAQRDYMKATGKSMAEPPQTPFPEGGGDNVAAKVKRRRAASEKKEIG